MMKYFRSLFYFLSVASFILFYNSVHADLISLFPLDNYNQNVQYWLNPSAPDYDRPLISTQTQQQRLNEFYNRFFSTDINSLSPWNKAYVNKLLQQAPPDDLQTLEQSIITTLNNENKPADQIGYGTNFRPYPAAWINNITDNMNLAQFNQPLAFVSANRGIALTNLNARALPTTDVHFYSYQLPGQGYPFDNLQVSSLWAGTPLYIIGQTQDRAWSLVLTPDYIAWVKSEGIARVDDAFIHNWQIAVQKKLVAITHTQTNITTNQHFRFQAYIGSVFPVVQMDKDHMQIFIPVAGINGQAKIEIATIGADEATVMPLAATPRNFSAILTNLQNRPYGWGNLYFYNDCSAELKSLYTPFAIYLARHSSDQTKAGAMVDMTSANLDDRINYLMSNGRKLMTIVYIGGHVFMYLGNYPNPNVSDHAPMAMTYQNVWGLSPEDKSRRAVIGEAVFFPLLKQYPEDLTLNSLANRQYFQVAYLDQMPTLPTAASIPDIKSLLKSLVYPY